MINLRKDVGLLNNLETTKTLGTLQVALNAVFIMRWLDPLGARGRLWFEYEMSSLARLAFWTLSSKLLRWSLLVRSWWLWAGSWRLHLALVLNGLFFPYVAKLVTACQTPITMNFIQQAFPSDGQQLFGSVNPDKHLLPCLCKYEYVAHWRLNLWSSPISASWELGTR